MNITVIGSGAMGSLFGGMLTEEGHNVTLFDVWEEHIEAMNNHGLKIRTLEGKKKNIEVKATTNSSFIDHTDLAIIFVKSTQTREAAKGTYDILTENVEVLTLQNGLGNPEIIKEFAPEENIIAGVTTHGSTLESPGRITHAGSGPTTIGRYFTKNDEKVHKVAEVLSSAGFDTTTSNNIKSKIWEKLLVNIGINYPTALGRVRNGLLTKTKTGERLIESSIREAMKVARKEGIKLRKDLVEYAKKIASSTGDNKSSMLQDIEKGKMTETKNLAGAIVRRAEKHNLEVPINRTFNDLIKTAEHRSNSL
ncbi:hypothetical protein AKJ51_00940 [candidate division MSBL1 archaeon SCGC-AAA382A20]|uniref:2-dehydropantoate 2-reductase n=1 Tax=candidate division MSBL1 archaeon SCGC-AAA382A20 TaxID=1698280 RepID=A0A133VMC6_9EURY|nr:hypothetical protein AKJ51_00940 [candidate division MSBL1 archaeon SCGC-AAA382A20]